MNNVERKVAEDFSNWRKETGRTDLSRIVEDMADYMEQRFLIKRGDRDDTNDNNHNHNDHIIVKNDNNDEDHNHNDHISEKNDNNDENNADNDNDEDDNDDTGSRSRRRTVVRSR